MARLTPDPTFYPSPAEAAAAPVETHAYVVTLNTGTNGDRAPDALTVIDLEEGSSTYGQVVGRLDLPNVGDELHHFGWNACSAALCPKMPHPHVERRYLLVPGLRSSRIYVVDTKPDPTQPKIVKTIERGGDRQQGRLLAPAHDPLRPGRDLRQRARQPRRRRARRHLPARPRRLQRQGRVGERPRPAGARLRLLVAPQLRHGDHQSEWGTPNMVEDGLDRRAAAGQQVRPQAARLGPRQAQPRAGDRPRRRSTRWCSSCGRRTTRARPTASSASSPRPRTSRPRCGSGSAPTTARSASRR